MDIRDYFSMMGESLASEYYDKPMQNQDVELLLEHDTGFSEYVVEAYNNACDSYEAKEESLGTYGIEL